MTLGHRRSRIGALCALALVLRPAASARATAPHAVLAFLPILTAIALLAVAHSQRWRRTLYAAVAPYAGWRAALVGGLVNDSGPVLLVYGLVGLAFATAYAGGDGERAR
jgi:hypothetical protein